MIPMVATKDEDCTSVGDQGGPSADTRVEACVLTAPFQGIRPWNGRRKKCIQLRGREKVQGHAEYLDWEKEMPKSKVSSEMENR